MSVRLLLISPEHNPGLRPWFIKKIHLSLLDSSKVHECTISLAPTYMQAHRFSSTLTTKRKDVCFRAEHLNTFTLLDIRESPTICYSKWQVLMKIKYPSLVILKYQVPERKRRFLETEPKSKDSRRLLLLTQVDSCENETSPHSLTNFHITLLFSQHIYTSYA